MKLSLIIDGNFIAVKNAFTLNNYKLLYGGLYKALLDNINRAKELYNWENVFFVADGKPSWRKDVYKEYKANRIKGDELDWDFVFKTLDEVIKEINDKNIAITFCEPKIEGDDWISCICAKNNKINIGNVVFSADRDMLQLLNYSSKNNWINFQIDDTQTRETTFIPEGYELVMSKLEKNNNLDIFDLSQVGIDFNSFFTKITSWNTKIVNPKQSLFVKLIHGDKSDNINSIYESMTKTNKIVNIGEDGAISIWNKFNEMNTFTGTKDHMLFDNIVNALSIVKKKELTSEELNNIKNRLDRNIKLIELSPRHLPNDIAETIIEKLTPYYE